MIFYVVPEKPFAGRSRIWLGLLLPLQHGVLDSKPGLHGRSPHQQREGGSEHPGHVKRFGEEGGYSMVFTYS